MFLPSVESIQEDFLQCTEYPYQLLGTFVLHSPLSWKTVLQMCIPALKQSAFCVTHSAICFVGNLQTWHTRTPCGNFHRHSLITWMANCELQWKIQLPCDMYCTFVQVICNIIYVYVHSTIGPLLMRKTQSTIFIKAPSIKGNMLPTSQQAMATYHTTRTYTSYTASESLSARNGWNVLIWHHFLTPDPCHL